VSDKETGLAISILKSLIDEHREWAEPHAVLGELMRQESERLAEKLSRAAMVNEGSSVAEDLVQFVQLLEEGVGHCLAAVDRQSNHFRAIRTLARCYLQQGEMAKAQAVVSEQLEPLQPQVAAFYSTLVANVSNMLDEAVSTAQPTTITATQAHPGHLPFTGFGDVDESDEID